MPPRSPAASRRSSENRSSARTLRPWRSRTSRLCAVHTLKTLAVTSWSKRRSRRQMPTRCAQLQYTVLRMPLSSTLYRLIHRLSLSFRVQNPGSSSTTIGRSAESRAIILSRRRSSRRSLAQYTNSRECHCSANGRILGRSATRSNSSTSNVGVRCARNTAQNT